MSTRRLDEEQKAWTYKIKKLQDLPPPCVHPEHNLPSHLYLPPGRYEHECLGCGEKTVFTVGALFCAGTSRTAIES